MGSGVPTMIPTGEHVPFFRFFLFFELFRFLTALFPEEGPERLLLPPARNCKHQVGLCIDVSYYNQVADWKAVKRFRIEFVMIRVGYRGYGTGVLVLDNQFENHQSCKGRRLESRLTSFTGAK